MRFPWMTPKTTSEQFSLYRFSPCSGRAKIRWPPCWWRPRPGQFCCVLVGQLMGLRKVVVECLGETSKNVTGGAAGAILGDGRVGLILHLDRIFRVLGRISWVKDP